MKRFALVSLVLSVAGVVAVGCGGDDETTQPTGWLYPNATSFCARAAEVVCNDEVVTGCYGSSSSSLEDDKQSCLDAYASQQVCNPNDLPYKPNAAEECISQLGSVWSDGRIDMTEYEAMTAACNKVFFEGRETDAECDKDIDCNTLDGAVCLLKTGQTQGTCQIPELVDNGNDCPADNAVCGEGYYCDPSAEACISRADIGDECGADKPCVESALCSEQTSLCVAKTANGGVCTNPLQCANGFCALPVGQTEGTCAAAITLDVTSSYCVPFRP